MNEPTAPAPLALGAYATGHAADTGHEVTGQVVHLRGDGVVYLRLPNDTHAVCYGAEPVTHITPEQIEQARRNALGALLRLDEAAGLLAVDDDLATLFDAERASLRAAIERLDDI